MHLSIPDDASTTQTGIAEFEAMWTAPDPQLVCRVAGNAGSWKDGILVLAVSSVIVPEERNLMLTPGRMRDVAIVSTRRFHFDTRLFAVSGGQRCAHSCPDQVGTETGIERIEETYVPALPETTDRQYPSIDRLVDECVLP
jgi:hypothetical protein